MNSPTESNAAVPSSSPDNAMKDSSTHDNQTTTTPSIDSATAMPHGDRLRVAMYLSNALPEFCVGTAKYIAGVSKQWLAEDRIKAMFLEDVEGNAVRKPYLATVSGTYVW